MRIGHFITAFPYEESFSNPEFYARYPIGGGEVCAYNLAVNTAKLGHDVSIFTTAVDASKHNKEFNNNIKVFRYPINLRIAKAFFSVNMFLQPLKYDVDILHVHFTAPPGYLAGFYYAKMKMPG